MLSENNIELLGDYINVDTPTLFKVNDFEFTITPYNIMKAINKSLFEFKKEIKEKNFEFIKISSYTPIGFEVLVKNNNGSHLTFTRGALRTFKDYRGTKIGRLTPISPVRSSNGVLCWECKCDCGSTKDRLILVEAAYLSAKSKLSCGCLQKETQVEHANFTKNVAKETFAKLLADYGGRIDGEYYSVRDAALCDFDGVKSYISFPTFKNTHKALDKLKTTIKLYGDSFDKIVPINGTGVFEIHIITRDGLKMKFSLTSYTKFANGRELFISNLAKINGRLVSPYTNSDDALHCEIGDNLCMIVPHRFNHYIKTAFVRFSNCVDNNGDTMLSCVHYNSNNGALFKIKTYDGAIVELYATGYYKFIEFRKSLYEKCSEVGLVLISPYSGSQYKVNCKIDNIVFGCLCANITSKTIPYIKKIKNDININGDTFLEFIKYSPNGLIAKIKTYDGAILEHYYGSYLDFCKGRKSFFNKIDKTNYTVHSPYIKSIAPILIDFKCGHGIIKTTANNFITRGGCPLCALSKGELIIIEYLDEKKIDYEYQYSIVGINERMSRAKYDIYISKYNLIIEINGIQHYEVDGYFNETQYDLDQNILNDINKYYYALENGYKYMQVDYREHKPKLALNRFKEQFNEFLKNNQN